MNDFNGQTGPALSGPDNKESAQCEVTAIQQPVTGGSVVAVSPAISLAVSPANGREQLTIETKGSQSSNKSGSKSYDKPNCYGCKHRRSLPGDAHSECVNPRISDVDRIITPVALMAGLSSAAMKRLNVSGDRHGIQSGWFMWPLNFDPTWLISCDGYEPKEAP